MHLSTSLKTFPTSHKFLTAFLCLLILLVGTFQIHDWLTIPSDLGPKLTYIGRHEFGCLQPPLSFLCITGGYEEYYFATDMGPAELPTYFKRAQYIKSWPAGVEGYGESEFSYKAEQGRTFNLSLYKDTLTNSRQYNLPLSHKAYVVIMLDSAYDAAKNAW